MKLWKKLSKIEDKIMNKIAYPGLVIAILLLIYIRWGHWTAWLWEVGSILLYLALSIGLVLMLIGSLLYLGERKKREQLEQELELLKLKRKQERDEP